MMRIINDIIADNIYLLTDLVDFKKLDRIFLSDNNYEDEEELKLVLFKL